MIEQIILDLKNLHGISVVLATHDLDLAARIADRVCLVRDGAVFAEGGPAEIFYDTALITEAGLALPQTVRTYLGYCAAAGIPPREYPLRHDELVRALRHDSR
jgi:cobalt/nickel transport system ATP-binding protein